VAHSARYWSAHHTWQTRFFNVPSVKHWYTGAFFLGRTSTYLLLVILVGVRGDRTRNPWVGSRVFYHWAKSPRYGNAPDKAEVYILNDFSGWRHPELTRLGAFRPQPNVISAVYVMYGTCRSVKVQVLL